MGRAAGCVLRAVGVARVITDNAVTACVPNQVLPAAPAPAPGPAALLGERLSPLA